MRTNSSAVIGKLIANADNSDVNGVVAACNANVTKVVRELKLIRNSVSLIWLLSCRDDQLCSTWWFTATLLFFMVTTFVDGWNNNVFIICVRSEKYYFFDQGNTPGGSTIIIIIIIIVFKHEFDLGGTVALLLQDHRTMLLCSVSRLFHNVRTKKF